MMLQAVLWRDRKPGSSEEHLGASQIPTPRLPWSAVAGPHYFTVTWFRKPCAAPEEVRVCSSDAVTIAYAKQACQGQVANCWPHSDTAILQAAITAFFFSSLHCTILHYEKDNSSELFWFFFYWNWCLHLKAHMNCLKENTQTHTENNAFESNIAISVRKNLGLETSDIPAPLLRSCNLCHLCSRNESFIPGASYPTWEMVLYMTRMLVCLQKSWSFHLQSPLGALSDSLYLFFSCPLLQVTSKYFTCQPFLGCLILCTLLTLLCFLLFYLPST